MQEVFERQARERDAQMADDVRAVLGTAASADALRDHLGAAADVMVQADIKK